MLNKTTVATPNKDGYFSKRWGDGYGDGQGEGYGSGRGHGGVTGAGYGRSAEYIDGLLEENNPSWKDIHDPN